jgi:putative membrane protein
MKFLFNKSASGKNHFRDRLDAVRTKLANERTILAYMRTALTFIIAGLTFVKFFNNVYIEIVGWIFIPVGVVTLVLGVYRYNVTREHIVELNDIAARNELETRRESTRDTL